MYGAGIGRAARERLFSSGGFTDFVHPLDKFRFQDEVSFPPRSPFA